MFTFWTLGELRPLFELYDVSNSDREQQLTLELLQAIEREESISQRNLAEQMGVALGLANSYLKRCVKKGLIKMSLAPANRYLYYLTPKGFAEKARLTSEFFATSLTLFRQAGGEYQRIFEELATDAVKPRVWFAGMSDLTEIAYLKVIQTEVEFCGVFSRQPSNKDGAIARDFFGAPIIDDISAVAGDIVVLTSLERTQTLIDELQSQCSANRVVVPSFLQGVTYRDNNIAASKLESELASDANEQDKAAAS